MTKTATPTKVEKFKAAVEAWNKLSWKLRDYGASDTEPDAVFQHCLRRASQREPFKMPKTARDWQLYTGMKGVGLAATHLTRSLQKCLDTMNEVPVAEYKELREYLDGFLWRC